jgi:ABC-type amino acid transport system permease subunit
VQGAVGPSAHVLMLSASDSVVWAIIAEIVRSGVLSLPRGQAEAAAAIGLTRVQSLRLIHLPQAFRVMLPALISQLVVILKDTSPGGHQRHRRVTTPEALATAEHSRLQTLVGPDESISLT